MAKDRTVLCRFYICRGKCEKGRDANYNGLCQRCPFYEKAPHRKPSRTNDKRNKEKNKYIE